MAENEGKFEEYVIERYKKEFLDEYKVKDIPSEDFKYGDYNGESEFSPEEKQDFDRAAKEFTSQLVKDYIRIVKVSFDKGVFEEQWKDLKFDKKSLKNILKEEMHPKTAIRTIMIGELIYDRVEALKSLGVEYDNENNRFINDQINRDITDFRNQYKEDGSKDAYDKIVQRNEEIEKFAKMVNRTGKSIDSTELQELMDFATSIGASLDTEIDVKETGKKNDNLNLTFGDGKKIKVESNIRN